MYTLTLSEEQAKIVVKALDLFSRLFIGQFEEIGRLFGARFLTGTASYFDFLSAAVYMKKELLPELSATSYYGITSEDIPGDARTAYDILQVINKALVEASGEEAGEIFPVAACSLPTIKMVEK